MTAALVNRMYCGNHHHHRITALRICSRRPEMTVYDIVALVSKRRRFEPGRGSRLDRRSACEALRQLDGDLSLLVARALPAAAAPAPCSTGRRAAVALADVRWLRDWAREGFVMVDKV